ncbi:MAG: helix-hairpin-helix domain-containing protein [Fibrobacterota bacterium]
MAKAKHIDEADRFEDMPNIGKEMAKDFVRLGFTHPKELAGQNADDLFERIQELTSTRHDPCVLDTYRAVVDFANGGPVRPWWDYTPLRKGDGK